MIDLKDYYRPQFYRKNWQDLNGQWDFAFDDKRIGEKEEWEIKFPQGTTIQVPFSYESQLSGINDEHFHPVIWYHKTIHITAKQREGCVFLHLEGSDYFTQIYVNGKCLAFHRGGSNRISVDLSCALKDGSNDLVMRVEDSENPRIPRGKQRWTHHNFGCWYTQTTGIWKPVWLEWTKSMYLDSVKITPDFINQKVHLCAKVAHTTAQCQLHVLVSFQGVIVADACKACTDTEISFDLGLINTAVSEWGVCCWSPAHPHLYDVQFTLSEGELIQDEVSSYFGLRSIEAMNGQVLLNGVPLYQKLILDQGYWDKSDLTPSSCEALEMDLRAIKEMGFNGVRKHQKVEDERFYYLCDTMGLLVWAEFPSSYQYSDEMVSSFTTEWMETIHQLYNHPSIITWTPLNESWGIPMVRLDKKQQHFSEMIYHLTKSIDPSRFVIVNDGWEHTVSDLITLHDYEENSERFIKRYRNHKNEIVENDLPFSKYKFAFADGYSYKGQPVLISEFGGIAFNDGIDGDWGYGKSVTSDEEYLNRLKNTIQALKEIPYIVGYCYTQLTDVQQEINGVLTADRKNKVPLSKIKEIIDAD